MDETPHQTGGEGSRVLQKEKKLYLLGGVGLVLAIGLIVLVITSGGGVNRGVPQRAAEETYTLVRDKVSKSAAIVLALPKGVQMTPVEAVEKVTFEPALSGTW